MTTINIPWAAWHGDEQIPLAFPASWDVTEARMITAIITERGVIVKPGLATVKKVFKHVQT